MDINELIKTSMKAGDKLALEAYRAVKGKIQLELTRGGTEKPDPERLFKDCVNREIKERKESNSFIKDSSSPDFVYNEKIIILLEGHLPKKLSEADQKKLISETVKSIGAQGLKDLGKVMGALTPKKDVLDMKQVSTWVKQILES